MEVRYLGRVFDDDEIINVDTARSQSLSIGELPVDTIRLTLSPITSRYLFAPLEDDSVVSEDYVPLFASDGKRLMTSEQSPFEGDSEPYTSFTETRESGEHTWYLQSLKRTQEDEYELDGCSTIGKLLKRTHYGGIYGADPNNPDTAGDVIRDICGNDIFVQIDSNFDNVELHGWLPVAPARDNLRRVLFAINSNLQTDPDGMLLITQTYAPSAPELTADDIDCNDATVEYSNPVTKIVVVAHSFWGSGTERELFSTSAAVDHELVVFSEPMHSLDRGTLTLHRSGANFAEVSGVGTLRGTPYNHTTSEAVQSLSNGEENVVRIEDATLIGVEEAPEVLMRLAEYYGCRNVINIAVTQAFLNPGAVLNVLDPFDNVMRSACIASMNTSVSAIEKSRVKALVGFTPWNHVEMVQEHIVLTESGTYTFPASIPEGTPVEVILISGGDAGIDGGNGADVNGWDFQIEVDRESKEQTLAHDPIPGGFNVIVPAGEPQYSFSPATGYTAAGVTTEDIVARLVPDTLFSSWVYYVAYERASPDNPVLNRKEYRIRYKPDFAKVGGEGGKAGRGGLVLRSMLTANPLQAFDVTIGEGGQRWKEENQAIDQRELRNGGHTSFGALSTDSPLAAREPYVDSWNGAETVYAGNGTDGVFGGIGGDGVASGAGNNGQGIGNNRGGNGNPATTDNFGKLERIGGNGGSGAVYGANGTDAARYNRSDYPGDLGTDGIGTTLPSSWKVYKKDRDATHVDFHYETDAAAGVDALPPATPSATAYGWGGNGGYGGSCTGGIGGFYGTAKYNTDADIWSYFVKMNGAAGGQGSLATNGVKGCVILKFSHPA